MKQKKNILFFLFICLASVMLSYFLAPDPARDWAGLPGEMTRDGEGYGSAGAQGGPMMPGDSVDESLAVIERLKVWGDRSDIEAPEGAVRWNLRGIVISGVTYIALIEAENRVSRYGAGDLLPNGETLRSVGSDYIEVEAEGDRTFIRLYE